MANFLAPRQLALPVFSVLAKLLSISHIAEQIAIQFDLPNTTSDLRTPSQLSTAHLLANLKRLHLTLF
jgi:hypothetical protein